MTIPQLSNRDVAQARHNGYQLIGQLFLYGVTPTNWPLIRQLPGLTSVLPESPTDTWYEQAAAEHHQLFALNLFPYETIFRDDTGLLNGHLTQMVTRAYEQIGYATRGPEPADHIGHELCALAFLCGAEADAWRDQRPGMATQMQNHQATLLHKHILQWYWPFHIGLIRLQSPLYSQLAQLLQQMLLDHLAERQLDILDADVPFRLESIASKLQLNDEETSLRDIVQFLLTPIRSGWFLSRDLIAHLGRIHKIPRGFGQREQMLLNLIRSAAHLGALDQLLDSLRQECQLWQHEYQYLSPYPNSETSLPVYLSPYNAPWLSRLDRTAAVLDQIQQRLAESTDLE